MAILIKDGMVYRNGQLSEEDILIDGDQISDIAPTIESPADTVIDANDLVVSPGFVDVHTHSDVQFLNPDNDGLSALAQGVTTVVAGNCGISAAPVSCYHGLLFYDGPQFESSESYFNMLAQAELPVNIGHLIGHCSLRIAAMENDQRVPSTEEMRAMKQELEQLMDRGCLGMSAGLIYVPGSFANPEELSELCQVVKAKGGIYTVHLRSEADNLIAAIQEQLSIARDSGVRLNISHLKAASTKMWGEIDTAINLIDSAASDMEIGADVYPYTAGYTVLQAVLPGELLKDQQFGPDLLQFLHRNESAYDVIEKKGLQNLCKDGYDSVLVLCSEPNYSGKTIGTLARELDKRPQEVLIEVLLKDQSANAIFLDVMCEEDVMKALMHPLSVIGSDGFVFPTGYSKNCHPRSYGTFSHVLRLAREGTIPLGTALAKMTHMPADRFNIPNRGKLEKGYFADITIFDPGVVTDRATYQKPCAPAVGVHYTILNGSIVYHDGAVCAKNGVLITRAGV